MITSQTNIERKVKFSFPDAIIWSMYTEGGKPVHAFDCLYCGPGSGDTSLVTTTQVPSQIGKMPTQMQSRRAQKKGSTSHQAGRDKWEELCEPGMLLAFNIWENTKKCVDKDTARVKKGLVDPGYRVPEPALFLSELSPEHCQARLDHDPPVRFPFPQQWSDILYGIPSQEDLEAAPTTSKSHGSGKRPMMQRSVLAPNEEVEWRGKYILIASLTDPPSRLIKAILWEIYKIGWCYKLTLYRVYQLFTCPVSWQCWFCAVVGGSANQCW
ncbi:hypothetical protein V8E55_006537 [Tylopilus felleus]